MTGAMTLSVRPAAEADIPAIASGATDEAIAIGVPDDEMGEAIRLVARGGGGGEAALRDHLKRELPGFMHPREFVWREALPLNASGKLDRARVRAEEGA